MYTNSGNRILTKYSDFLKQTQGNEGLLSLDSGNLEAASKKRVNSESLSSVSSSSSSSSSRSNSSNSVLVHGNGRTNVATINAQVHRADDDAADPVGEAAPTTSKFSDLFSPRESNALYRRNQLINSEDGRFLQEAVVANDTSNSNVELFQESNPPAGAAAIPLLPPQYSTSSLQHSTGSGTSSINPDINSVQLRRELLNNIRAISKATFFEDLYVNNGAIVPGSSPTRPPPLVPAPDSPEAELPDSKSERIVSERGEFLVFETQLPLSPRESTHSHSNLEQSKLARVDEWIRNSQENLIQHMQNGPIHEEIEEEREVNLESEPEVNVPEVEQNESQVDIFSYANTIVPKSDQKLVPDGFVDEFVPNEGSPLKFSSPPPFQHENLHENITDSTELFANRIPSPYPSSPTISAKTTTFSKVHYPSILTTPATRGRRSRSPRPPLYGVKLPGILRRQNMDQWVAKILRFYINGDEHASKYEFRFRPGRDVRSWDGLCDTLSERLNLPRGVRYIFTLDGQLVESLDHLKHGRAYVVSSNKKFKALNYGGEVEGSGDESEEPPYHRPPSAPPTQKHPPVIRVRRERSLNGVAWGSPQQLSMTSGSETNNNKPNNPKMLPPLRNQALGVTGPRGNAAETVVQAAIDAASSRLGTRVTLPMKQVVRIINGSNPNVQSQVLLNTRVSQDWNDLVKDLGLSVKVPRNANSRLETLVGRQIQSYSQLRSELKVGNNAFYIYILNKEGEKKLPKYEEESLGVRRSTSHPSISQYKKSNNQNDKLNIPPNRSTNTPRSNFNSTPNLTSTSHPSQQNHLLNPQLNVKRKSHRKRSQASTYLVSNHRSRSPSPF